MNFSIFFMMTIVASSPFSSDRESYKNEPAPTEEIFTHEAAYQETTTTATTTIGTNIEVQEVAAFLPERLAANRTYLEENFKDGDYIAASDDDGNYLWGFVFHCRCFLIGVTSFGGKIPYCCRQ